MSTLVHGIAASENIDTTGEIVSISGMDISSLAIDGVLNWEHKNDQPSQVVGKILKAKKIFSETDCDNEYELYFWNKCKVPYLYIIGELFDEYKDSSREVAGMFRYDADHKHKHERSVMNFSIEGAKIKKEGVTVERSIARKVTITILACNKAAVAEMIPTKEKVKDELDLFKTENIEIEVLHLNETSKLWDLLKKEDPAKHAAKLGIKPFIKDEMGLATGVSNALGGAGPSSPGGILAASEGNMQKSQLTAVGPNGIKIGSTQSGKDIMSHGKVADYHGFSMQDHKDAHAAHTKIAQKFGSMGRSKEAIRHQQKAKLHFSRATTMGDKAKISSSGIVKTENMKKAALTFPNVKKPKEDATPKSKVPEKFKGKSPEFKGTVHTTVEHIEPHYSGSHDTVYLASGHRSEGHKPGKFKVGDKVTAKQHIMGTHILEHGHDDMKKALTAGSGLAAPSQLVGGSALAKESLESKPQKISKSKWFTKAEEAYEKWGKREQFRNYMKSKMPHLTKGEIDAIGCTLMLHKAMQEEKNLQKAPVSEPQHSFYVKKE